MRNFDNLFIISNSWITCCVLDQNPCSEWTVFFFLLNNLPLMFSGLKAELHAGSMSFANEFKLLYNLQYTTKHKVYVKLFWFSKKKKKLSFGRNRLDNFSLGGFTFLYHNQKHWFACLGNCTTNCVYKTSSISAANAFTSSRAVVRASVVSFRSLSPAESLSLWYFLETALQADLQIHQIPSS